MPSYELLSQNSWTEKLSAPMVKRPRDLQHPNQNPPSAIEDAAVTTIAGGGYPVYFSAVQALSKMCHESTHKHLHVFIMRLIKSPGVF